ncbi:MAG: DUF4127 family protein [Eubacteriales bacterium]|nr:DUF4127 family protein [Eubacteriales bacterium]
MQKIMLLPLDERPCNAAFPALMMRGNAAFELLAPPRALLGDKKRPADTEALWGWCEQHIAECSAAVLSLDLWVYGGIVPSRLHHLSLEEARRRLDRLRALRRLAPGVRLYAFNLITRAPAYNSSDEEPDYYETCGEQLNLFGQLLDRRERGLLTEAENEKYAALEQAIPSSVLKDFEERRAINHAINERSLALAEDGTLDFLVIPLDDCAKYGWTARERRALQCAVVEKRLSGRVFLYSGADEVGGVLLARAANQLLGRTPAVFLYYSAVGGERVVPKFEDRPLGENLKWQIAAAGGVLADTADEADFLLLVNAPVASGADMGEADIPYAQLDSRYTSERCLPEFVAHLRRWTARKPIALADLAFANGADDELVSLLAQEGLLKRLDSFAGWNTAANAAGTCIAHMMLRACPGERDASFLHLRLLEDWAYMAHVRGEAAQWAEEHGPEEAPLKAFVRDGLQRRAQELALPVTVEAVDFPWKRLFEVSMRITSAKEKGDKQ